MAYYLEAAMERAMKIQEVLPSLSPDPQVAPSR